MVREVKNRRSRTWAVVATLVIVGIVGAAVTAATAAGKTRANVTLTVDVFGDFGFKDLYQQYEQSHPGVTIKEDTEDYAPHHTALAQHLATGAGADDIVAVEVGFIAQFAAQPQNFVDLRQYGAASLKSRYLPWKYQQAVAHNGAVIGLGLAYTSGQIVSSRVYAIKASDPVILSVATLLIIAITLLATSIPATRAARLQPANALRSE